MASAPAPDDTASWSDLLRSGYLATLVLVCLGIWLHAGDELMVATVVPSMIGEIGGDPYIGWLTALYEVGSITASALGAWFARRTGIRASLVGAALVYAAGCLLSGLSPVIFGVLAGRLVQGLGGGAIVAVSLIAAWRAFPGRLLPRAVAAVSLVWGVAAFAGPMVGALFVEWGHWRGAFLFFAAQALAYAAAHAFIRMPGEHETGPAALPLGRMSVLAAGVVAVAAAGVIHEPLWALASGATGVALVAAFVLLDARGGTGRLLPAHAVKLSSPAGATMLLVLGLSTGAIALLIYGPVFLHLLHGFSAFATGLVLMLESVGWSLAAMLISGQPRNREKALIVGGAGIVLSGVVGLGLTIAWGPPWLIPLFAVLQGAGFGMSWTFILRRAVAIVATDDRERVTSAINTVQRFGYALGAAAIGIVANRAGMSVDMALEQARTVTLIVFALTLLPALAGLVGALRFVRFEERTD